MYLNYVSVCSSVYVGNPSHKLRLLSLGSGNYGRTSVGDHMLINASFRGWGSLLKGYAL